MNRLLVASLVAAAACTTPRAQVSPPPPPPPVVAADVPAPPDAAPLPDVAPDASAAPDASPDPRELRLRALANGSAPLADAIDPARGVTVVRHIEAPPSGQGRARITDQRLCGAALARALPAIRRDLAAAVEQADAGEGFFCDPAGTCVTPGMEYQPEWRVTFVDAQGTLRLEAIAQVSVAALDEAWVDRANAHVARALAASRARPCAGQR